MPPGLPCRPQVVEVAPGDDLQLHPAVPLGDPAPDLGGHCVGGGEQAEGHPGGHGPGRTGWVRRQCAGQWRARGPAFRVEQGQLQCGLGHGVAHHVVERTGHAGRRHAGGALGRGHEQPGHEMVPQHHQGAAGELRGVGRFGEGGALAPSLAVGPHDVHEDCRAHGDGAVGRSERGDEGEGHDPELHHVDPHGRRA